MTTDKKPKTVPLVRFGATLPLDLHRKLKSILVARGESLQAWLAKVATAEVDGTIVFGVGQHGATSQNAAPAPRPAPKALPGE